MELIPVADDIGAKFMLTDEALECVKQVHVQKSTRTIQLVLRYKTGVFRIGCKNQRRPSKRDFVPVTIRTGRIKLDLDD